MAVPRTYPDPSSFKKFDFLLHKDGTHALCIMAEWQISQPDFSYLMKINASLVIPLITQTKEGVFYIFDIPLKISSYYDPKPPQLVLINGKRTLHAR